MRAVSPLLKRIVYPLLANAGVFRRTRRSGLAVLTYHGILPHDYTSMDPSFDGNLIGADTFRSHLILLKKNYSIVSPEDVLAWCEERGKLPPKAVLLTCDDGLLNNLTDMLPILRKEELKCLFFVTSASAGEKRTTLWYEDLFLIFFRAPSGPFEISCQNITIKGDLTEPKQRRSIWWDTVKRLSAFDADSRNTFLNSARQALHSEAKDDPLVSERRFGLLVGDELQALKAAGMTIGAHTLSHPMLSRCPPQIAWDEISQSRVRLEAALQTRIWAMAYPFGDPESVTPELVKMTRDASYNAAFMNFDGGLGVPLPLHTIPRIHVTREMSLPELEANVAGFHVALQRALSNPRGVFS